MTNSLPASGERLQRQRSALLVVDMQERILPTIVDHQRLTWNVRRLIDGAKLFDVPVTVTEQYPQGLGSTTPVLLAGLDDPAISKRRFSCLECGEIVEAWRNDERFQIVVAGIESHVCVLQTVLDLLAESFRVHVVVDAVSANAELDHQVALQRMEASGATLSTVQTTLFEWCDDSRDSRFKSLSDLIRKKFEPPEPP